MSREQSHSLNNTVTELVTGIVDDTIEYIVDRGENNQAKMHLRKMLKSILNNYNKYTDENKAKLLSIFKGEDLKHSITEEEKATISYMETTIGHFCSLLSGDYQEINKDLKLDRIMAVPSETEGKNRIASSIKNLAKETAQEAFSKLKISVSNGMNTDISDEEMAASTFGQQKFTTRVERKNHINTQR